jgi:hypothetical protein
MKRIAVAAALLALVSFLIVRRAPDRPDSTAVVAQIRQLNELATVRYTVQKVVGIREPKYPVGEEAILLVVQARVEAGVDLAHLGPDQVQLQGDTVTVRLPPAQILNVSIDEKETRVWDRSKTWWTPWVRYSKELESRARQQGLDAAKQAALEMGILKQASQNADVSIRGLLNLAGVKTVRIIAADLS